jgi:hypothetical protein
MSAEGIDRTTIVVRAPVATAAANIPAKVGNWLRVEESALRCQSIATQIALKSAIEIQQLRMAALLSNIPVCRFHAIWTKIAASDRPAMKRKGQRLLCSALACTISFK